MAVHDGLTGKLTGLRTDLGLLCDLGLEGELGVGLALVGGGQQVCPGDPPAQGQSRLH